MMMMKWKLFVVLFSIGSIMSCEEPMDKQSLYVEQRVVTECAYIGRVDRESDDVNIYSCAFKDNICYVAVNRSGGSTSDYTSISCRDIKKEEKE